MIRAGASLRSLVAGAAVAVAVVVTAVTPSGQAPRAAAQPRAAAEGARPLRLLFLGHDRDHHPSGKLLPLIAAPLARRGIQMTHVSTPEEALVASTLKHYDGLVLYANHETITPEQEQALVDFVEGGKAMVVIHCASFMFTKAPRYIPMVGGQFQRHGTGEFTAEIVAPDHPVMKGLKPFTTWDETYVHTRHNTVDRTVLMERVDKEGREPYTWVRTQGKGRVFYTAFGHDERTWGNPGFRQLIEQGIVWAVDDQARAAWQRLKMPEVEYVEGFNVPNYEKRDPAPKYQLPMTAADSQKFIQTPAEFKVELFAQEPMLGGKPITFSFDERGRLWVIEAIDYPNRVLRGGEGDDRIRILEDTNGDGKADKATVFADHLNLPTSLVFANGGVIVAAAPHMLFLQDTNGDDKADVKKVISTGWGIADTHAGPSNLLYGPDNYVWGVVGYSGFDGEMNGKPMKFLQGVYRYKPDGSHFEYVTGSTNNTWGLGFSETFDVFGSTANNDPSFYVAIPNRFFEKVPELTAGVRTISGPGYQSAAQFYPAHFLTPYIRQVDVWGGYTAAAGHQLYTARSFPKKYWNRIAFITEPTAHLVGQGIMEPQGAGFVTRDGWNLIAGAEEWFSPVHAQVGPDGAVWIADWYTFINQHNPTPPGHSNGPGNAYETSMRDKSRGRIYRVVYRDAPAAKTPALSKADPAGLVAALKSDNMLWRLHAQRLLVERGKLDVVPQLVALTADRTVDAVGTNGAAFHALWTLHGLGAISSTTTEAGRAAVQALAHPAAGVRKAAAMVLPASPETAPATTAAHPRLEDPRRHGSAHPAGGDPAPRRAAGLRRRRQGALRRLAGAVELPRSLGEPRPLHRRQPAQGAVPDAVPRRPGEAGRRRAADRPAPRARPARLAGAGRGRARLGLEVDGGAGQLGITRPDRVRRRRVVHARRSTGRPIGVARRRSASGASATSARCGSTAPASPPPRSIRPRAAARRCSRCRTACSSPAPTPSPSASRTCAATAASSARPTRWSCRAASTRLHSAARGVTASSGRPTRRRSTASRASSPPTSPRPGRRRRRTPCWPRGRPPPRPTSCCVSAC